MEIDALSLYRALREVVTACNAISVAVYQGSIGPAEASERVRPAARLLAEAVGIAVAPEREG